METRRQSDFLDKMKREEIPPLSSNKDAFGRGTDESGTESETGRSLAIVETMNVRPEMGWARAEFFFNVVPGESGSEFLALI